MLTVACVGTDQTGVNQSLNHVADFVRQDREAELTDMQMEFL